MKHKDYKKKENTFEMFLKRVIYNLRFHCMQINIESFVKTVLVSDNVFFFGEG